MPPILIDHILALVLTTKQWRRLQADVEGGLAPCWFEDLQQCDRLDSSFNDWAIHMEKIADDVEGGDGDEINIGGGPATSAQNNSNNRAHRLPGTIPSKRPTVEINDGHFSAGEAVDSDEDEDDEDDRFFDCSDDNESYLEVDDSSVGNAVLTNKGPADDESDFASSDKENRFLDGEETNTNTNGSSSGGDHNDHPSDGKKVDLPRRRVFISHYSSGEEVDNKVHQDFERRQTTRSPLSTLVERVITTNTNTVDEVATSEDTEYACKAGYDTNNDVSTLIDPDSAFDRGNEADTEDGTALDVDSDDEDPCRDVVPQNAAPAHTNTGRITGWVAGDIALRDKRGRESDEDDDVYGFESRWALKRRRETY